MPLVGSAAKGRCHGAGGEYAVRSGLPAGGGDHGFRGGNPVATTFCSKGWVPTQGSKPGFAFPPPLLYNKKHLI